MDTQNPTRERDTWDQYFLNLAQQAATRATCPRMHAGAVLVQNRRVKSTGYNGSPAGRPHCTQLGCLMWEGHCVRTIHAETNALLDAGREAQGSRLYITNVPCVECCKLIIQAQVYDVLIPDGAAYQDNRLPLFGYVSAVELLRRAGVQTRFVPVSRLAATLAQAEAEAETMQAQTAQRGAQP